MTTDTWFEQIETLTTPTFSQSVGDAIETLRESLELDDLRGALDTSEMPDLLLINLHSTSFKRVFKTAPTDLVVVICVDVQAETDQTRYMVRSYNAKKPKTGVCHKSSTDLDEILVYLNGVLPVV